MKWKKIALIFLAILWITLPVQASDDILAEQQSSLHISDFIAEANRYTEEAFPNLNMSDVLNSAIKGEINSSFWYKVITSVLGKEVISAIRILASILVIIILHSILKSISDGLENKGVSQMIYYVQYLLIVALIMTNFSEMLVLTKDTIEKLVGFMDSLVPILVTLMVTTGSITTANVVQPVILFLVSFIGNAILVIVLPFVMVSTVLGIVSNLSDKVSIGKLAKYFKSGIAWLLGVVLTIFVGVLSIEGTLTSSVDGITAKATKAAVSNFIPVVGKILGDAVDTVLGCATVLKNAVGLVGVLVVIGICILPIIKLAVLTISYHLAGAVCEMVADEKIVKLLDQMASSFKILLAVLFAVSTMLMIGVTLVIKISNSGMMYR